MRTTGTHRLQQLAAALLMGGACLLPAHAADRGAPATAVRPVTDSYGDVKLVDPYRWLESTSDPEVKRWSAAQDQRTRAYFDQLPLRKPMFERLMKQASASSSSYAHLHAAGGRLFAMYSKPPKQQPMLAVMGADADPAHARVVLDPNTLNPKGTTAIDWFVPSSDGTRVAVSMSENGSEDGSVHIFDVATGTQLDAVIPRVQFATGGGSLAWRPDGSGFWYTRYPGADEPAERQHFYQQIYFHRLGDDPAKDRLVLGHGFPKVAEIALKTGPGSTGVIASVANGDGGEFAHYLIGLDGSSRQITRFEDKVVAATLGTDGIYLVSRKDAPRGQLLKLPLHDPQLARAQLLVPQAESVIPNGGVAGDEPVLVTAHGLYLREIVGGPSQVRAFDHAGKPLGKLELPEVASVEEITAMDNASLLICVRTYLEPGKVLRFDEASSRLAPTALQQTSPVHFDDVEVVREFATSKDGTRIPLNIVRKKGLKLDGSHPLLITGYGGYNVSLEPGFLGATTRLWLDAGGVYVIANLRGGGEFGETWHAQGALTHKQNVFDDFAAAGQYLVSKGYTSNARMAAQGGSNGGLLMGAVLTQHPQMFRAVVSSVGIYDMLRVERDPNGTFNVTEYGSVTDPAQFQALRAYSPYHHVQDGAAYPAVFMITGETDGRVNPMHSRKMVARLQAATGSDRPIYLSINAHAGHGIGSALSITVNQRADAYAFLFDQLGMKYPANKQ